MHCLEAHPNRLPPPAGESLTCSHDFLVLCAAPELSAPQPAPRNARREPDLIDGNSMFWRPPATDFLRNSLQY